MDILVMNTNNPANNQKKPKQTARKENCENKLMNLAGEKTFSSEISLVFQF